MFRRMSRRSAALAVAVAAGALILTGCASDHSDMAMSSDSAMVDPAGDANAADVMFSQMMIPHHEQAVEMAELAPDRAESAEIQQLASDIAGAQDPEIDLMSSWLDEWGAPRMSGTEAMGSHGGHGGGMEGMLTQEQLDELAATSGAEFDRLFAQYMIEHHLGAIAMAEDVLANGADPRVRELAETIIAAQQAEIDQMRAFLDGDATAAGLDLVTLQPTLEHVHGAAVMDGALVLATHNGLHAADLETGETTLLGAHGSDLMGFAASGGTMVASGHPGHDAGLPDPMGLIRSTDSGETWEPVSLTGEVDFHGLAMDGDNIAGMATYAGLLVSSDGGQTWTEGPAEEPMAVAWFDGWLWIATPAGLTGWNPQTAQVTAIDGAAQAVALAAAADGSALWGVAPDGTLWRSTDGATATAVTQVPALEALAATGDTAYIINANVVEAIQA